MPSAEQQIVLLGPGHTHLEIIRRWQQQPIAGARMTVVGRYFHSTYSGMLPGTLAGCYSPNAMRVPLEPLCAAAGVDCIVGDVERVDLAEQTLHFHDRQSLAYDWLSIGIGSVPDRSMLEQQDAETLLPIKPMQTFLERWENRVEPVMDDARLTGEPPSVAIVGGGAGGVEIAMCARQALRRDFADQPVGLSIYDSGDQLAADLSPAAQRKVNAALQRRDIAVHLNHKVTSVEHRLLKFADGSLTVADIVIWVTGAVAPELAASLDLPRDPRGFPLTNDRLQSRGEERVFVVGDTGTWEDHPTPKAGVHAVRQAPVLWQNLRAATRGRRLKKYRPQSDFLRLLNCGDGTAIADYRGFAFHNRLCWQLKNRIDRQFIAQYQVPSVSPGDGN